jgi:predicted transcriptional regulator of viral defense system
MRGSAKEKLLTATLARASSTGLISVQDAAAALGVGPTEAATNLARLSNKGWAQRVRRGLYFILPLEAHPGQPVTTEDPWVLARELFSPCYIGGWSAAEHWGLTEQVFRSTLVVTAAATRRARAEFLGNEFRLYRVRPSKLSAGVVRVWRGAEQVPVSSAERTLVDGLHAPETCGGIRHLAQMLQEYGERGPADFGRLIAIADEVASGAAWKRLGFLAELLFPGNRELAAAAKKRLTAGNSRLDPAIPKRGHLVSRWRLWVNVALDDFRPGTSAG